ncbi:MAG: DNA polymerase III subunit delta [Flavobacteriales bacterium]|nr:DNA polymerase III subunit delta [Flavobacteriales bacterium]
MKKAEEIIRSIKKRDFSPVYFLSGEEPFFTDYIADLIDDTLLDEGQKDFDSQVFYGKDSNVLDIISSAKQYPILAENRMVIVREAQLLKGIEKFKDYFQKIAPKTVLVICYRQKKIDKRSALYKSFPKEIAFLEAKPLYENEAFKWVENFVTDSKRKIAPGSIRLLLEKTGTNLSLIYNELVKLFITIPEGEALTEDIIAEKIGVLKEFTIFELQKAISTRNALRCQMIVKHFAQNPKKHPLVVTLSSLYNYITKLIIIHGMNTQNEREIAKAIGVHPFFVGEYLTAAKYLDLRKSVQILSFLREADVRSKGYDNVSLSDEQLLKELVFKMIHI